MNKPKRKHGRDHHTEDLIVPNAKRRKLNGHEGENLTHEDKQSLLAATKYESNAPNIYVYAKTLFSEMPPDTVGNSDLKSVQQNGYELQTIPLYASITVKVLKFMLSNLLGNPSLIP